MAGDDVSDAQCGETWTRPSANTQHWQANSTLRQTPQVDAYVQLHISVNVLTNRKVRVKSPQRLRGKTPARPAKRKKIVSLAEYEAEAKGTSATGAKKATKATGKAKAPTKRPTGQRDAKGAKRPSGLDAAAQVLAEAKEPLGAKEIVERMLAKGLWQTSGRTPSATIYAAVIREIAAKGDDGRFRKVDRGKFELAK